MREAGEHLQAFDEYYKMGKDRSLRVLADHRKITVRTAKTWSKEFNWQLRVQQRDIDNSKKIEEGTDKKLVDAAVNTKADYRKDIRLALQPVKAAINEVMVFNKKTGQYELGIDVEDPKGLLAIITSFEKLAKLDLQIIGEGDGGVDRIVIINDTPRPAHGS